MKTIGFLLIFQSLGIVYFRQKPLKNEMTMYVLKFVILKSILLTVYDLGVQVQNMKMDFNIYGTWRRVGQ